MMQRLSVDHPESSDTTTGASDSERRSHQTAVVSSLVPQMVEEKVAEVVKGDSTRAGFGTNCGADRTCARRDLTGVQVQQRTVELDHGLEHETDEVSEKSDVMKTGPDAGGEPVCQGEWFDHGLDPRRRLIRRAR